MHEQVYKQLVPYLLKLNGNENNNLNKLAGAKFKMTMFPSIGLFIVISESNLKLLVNF